MKIAIGCDHGGYQLKLEIIKYLETLNHEVIDAGCDSLDSCNYAVYGEKVAQLVANGEVAGGILICGTGVGISIAANKVKGIRACVCSEPTTAHLSKLHNDANIIAFGARIVGYEVAKAIVDTWLNTTYEGGRHQARIDYFTTIENKQ